MTLLQPSFRGRLRLFFVVIVVIPMIAVGVVLFQFLDVGESVKLDSTLAEASTGAQSLYRESRDDGRRASKPITMDQELALAIKTGDRPAVQRRIDALDEQIGAELIQLRVRGMRPVRTGSALAVAAAQAPLEDANQDPIGTLAVSVTSAQGYVDRVLRV